MRYSVENNLTVALAGNPNVGKSTLFNTLTGSRQHTGNWPGKTVGVEKGYKKWKDTRFQFLDLPGTYSMQGNSPEEQTAAAYLNNENFDCTVVVCDGSCLERSLLLALQLIQQQTKIVVCVNLMDEAQCQGISVDAKKLEDMLDTPVVLTSAGKGEGIQKLLEQVRYTALSPPKQNLPNWASHVAAAEEMVKMCTCQVRNDDFRQQVDRLIVSRRFGIPLMYLLLFVVLWLTVWGANYPGKLLESIFSSGYYWLQSMLIWMPVWLREVLLDGIYATCTRVISVMLPPMAIFFPLFSILEDIGYLPRMAFMLDPCMARCGGCGKQALTLCMGLGCNAVGVMGCRIIDSPRERLAAILTNAMVPCNGRFPALILLASVFFPKLGVVAVAACVALGAAGATVTSGILCKTVLRASSSSFLMEIPPFRRPRLGKILRQSLVEKAGAMVWRTMKVAAPAGVILWLGVKTGLLPVLAAWLEPLGLLLGMSGVILLGFLFCLPANELLLPVIIMMFTGVANLQTVSLLNARQLLLENISLQNAICMMVFTLFHWPCATTLMTVYRETGSLRKTAAAAMLPTAVGCFLCLVLQLLI